jgi:hypothetical protein
MLFKKIHKKIDRLNKIEKKLNNSNPDLSSLINELKSIESWFNKMIHSNKMNHSNKMIHLYPLNNKFGFGSGEISQYYTINKENFEKYEIAMKNSYIVHVDIAASTKKALKLRKDFTDYQPLIQAILQTYEPDENELKPLFVHFAGDAYGFIFFNESQVMKWATNALVVLYIIIKVIMTDNITKLPGVVKFGVIPKLNLEGISNLSSQHSQISPLKAPRTVIDYIQNNPKYIEMDNGIEIRIGIYKFGNDVKDIDITECKNDNGNLLLEYQSINNHENDKDIKIIRINNNLLCIPIKLEENAKNGDNNNCIRTNFDINNSMLNNYINKINNNLIEINKQSLNKIINLYINKHIKSLIDNNSGSMIMIISYILHNIDNNFFNLYKHVLNNKYLISKHNNESNNVIKSTQFQHSIQGSLGYYADKCEDFENINGKTFPFVMYGTTNELIDIKILQTHLTESNGLIVKVFNKKSFYALFKNVKDSIKFAENIINKYIKSKIGIYHLNKNDYFHNLRENYYKDKDNKLCVLDIIGPPFNYVERVKTWGLPKEIYGYALYSEILTEELKKTHNLKKYSPDEFNNQYTNDKTFKSKWGDSGLKPEHIFYKISASK